VRAPYAIIRKSSPPPPPARPAHRPATALEHRRRCALCSRRISVGQTIREVPRAAAKGPHVKLGDRLVCACAADLDDAQVHAEVDRLYVEWIKIRERYAVFIEEGD
jgi:hypothetical protein